MSAERTLFCIVFVSALYLSRVLRSAWTFYCTAADIAWFRYIITFGIPKADDCSHYKHTISSLITNGYNSRNEDIFQNQSSSPLFPSSPFFLCPDMRAYSRNPCTARLRSVHGVAAARVWVIPGTCCGRWWLLNSFR